MTARRTALAIGAVGLVGAYVVAREAAMGRNDALALLAWALGTAVCGGLVMAWAVRRARGASVVVQMALLTGGTAAIVSVGRLARRAGDVLLHPRPLGAGGAAPGRGNRGRRRGHPGRRAARPIG